jgi:hypothetical protein
MMTDEFIGYWKYAPRTLLALLALYVAAKFLVRQAISRETARLSVYGIIFADGILAILTLGGLSHSAAHTSYRPVICGHGLKGLREICGSASTFHGAPQYLLLYTSLRNMKS